MLYTQRDRAGLTQKEAKNLWNTFSGTLRILDDLAPPDLKLTKHPYVSTIKYVLQNKSEAKPGEMDKIIKFLGCLSRLIQVIHTAYSNKDKSDLESRTANFFENFKGQITEHFNHQQHASLIKPDDLPEIESL
ncbi:MAG: hypothetical protein FJZ57_07440 [Chlamydiae bacterium]|nr:hypothetical protein [Chlamydiota bacterium]